MKTLKLNFTVILLLLLVVPSSTHAQFRDGDIIALRSDTGKWMTRCNNCQRAATSNTVTVHVSANAASQLPTYAKFKVKLMPNGKIALQADTGKFLARCNGCLPGGPIDILTVHVSSPNPSYAQFKPVALSNGKYAFLSDNGNYLARCRSCSPGATYSDIVGIHAGNYSGAYAQWNVSFIGSNDSASPIPVKLPTGTFIYVYPKDNFRGSYTPHNRLIRMSTRNSTSAAKNDFNGEGNTKAIVKAMDAFYAGDGPSRFNYGAERCDDLVAYGFSDWYLPSAGELNAIYKQLGPKASGGSGRFVRNYYWSSSLYNNYLGWAQDFKTGSFLTEERGSKNSCLCVRK
ncbi:MAG: hypothetical protein AAF489_08030 [Bacteroidota bacterium]